jgi:hypothetical protein
MFPIENYLKKYRVIHETSDENFVICNPKYRKHLELDILFNSNPRSLANKINHDTFALLRLWACYDQIFLQQTWMLPLWKSSSVNKCSLRTIFFYIVHTGVPLDILKKPYFYSSQKFEFCGQ